MNFSRIIVPAFALLLLMQTAGCGQSDAAYRTLSPTEAMNMIRTDSSLVLLDVRTPAEFGGELGHLKGAQLLPVQELDARIAELERLKDRPILVYCRSGSRSSRAADRLAEHGYTIFMLEGGMLDWNASGLPVENGSEGGTAQ